jgi:hypothetical protein
VSTQRVVQIPFFHSEAKTLWMAYLIRAVKETVTTGHGCVLEAGANAVAFAPFAQDATNVFYWDRHQGGVDEQDCHRHCFAVFLAQANGKGA